MTRRVIDGLILRMRLRCCIDACVLQQWLQASRLASHIDGIESRLLTATGSVVVILVGAVIDRFGGSAVIATSVAAIARIVTTATTAAGGKHCGQENREGPACLVQTSVGLHGLHGRVLSAPRARLQIIEGMKSALLPRVVNHQKRLPCRCTWCITKAWPKGMIDNDQVSMRHEFSGTWTWSTDTGNGSNGGAVRSSQCKSAREVYPNSCFLQ